MDARAPLRPFVWLSSWEGLPLAIAASGLSGLVAYLGLASRAPGIALLLASGAWFVAICGAFFWRWPVERKITLERQAEVVGYRIAAAVLAYFLLGAAILWALNSLSPDQARVPFAWEGSLLRPWENPFFRRVTFWPFYMLVLVGCQGILPTPPGAC